MELEVLAEKYALAPETVGFMRQYGYDEAEKDYHWRRKELEYDALTERWKFLRLPGSADAAEKALCKAERSEHFRHLFNYLYFYWYKYEKALIYNHKLPDMSKCLGDEEQSGLLELLMAVAGSYAVERKFDDMGLERSYAECALQRISEDTVFHSSRAGRLLYPADGHHWMRFFVEGKLFRIGRFEYMTLPETIQFAPHIFRHRESGKVIALCRDDWKFDCGGWRLWRDYPDEKPYFTASLQETDEFICGTPVDPAGFAEVDRTVTLRKDEFEPLWRDGDLVPDIHIPPGGNMHRELCRSSLEDAVSFFEKYFHCTPKAFTCFSWILNPDLGGLLPDSNMARFMREVYLTPFSGSSLSGLYFVFGKEDKDWSNYPAENSVQRAFHTLRKENKRLKTGGMFIDRRGIEQFGQGLYRREYGEISEKLCKKI